jgi:hypothetical protein
MQRSNVSFVGDSRNGQYETPRLSRAFGSAPASMRQVTVVLALVDFKHVSKAAHGGDKSGV